MSDEVNQPAHYTFASIEVIDYITDRGLGFALGNVVKYCARADFKGKRTQDLQKALWYVAKAREASNADQLFNRDAVRELTAEEVTEEWVKGNNHWLGIVVHAVQSITEKKYYDDYQMELTMLELAIRSALCISC
jgi:hypothetical protein